MPHTPLLNIHVAFACPKRYRVISIMVPEATTVSSAIEASGILALFPDIDLKNNRVGIFGKLVALERVLQAHDRVEIYLPLSQSAMDARRVRAKKPLKRPQPARHA